MKQRVGIRACAGHRPKGAAHGRAFGALDAQTRETCRPSCSSSTPHQEDHPFVTHDLDEAVLIADGSW